jgi:hypothetical protein
MTAAGGAMAKRELRIGADALLFCISYKMKGFLWNLRLKKI